MQNKLCIGVCTDEAVSGSVQIRVCVMMFMDEALCHMCTDEALCRDVMDDALCWNMCR